MSTLQPLRARLQRAARENRTALAAVALAALALGTLWSTQAASATRVQVATIPAPDAWTESATFTYRVPVANASGPYAAGTVLGMGEPGYFTTISPRFEVAFRWEPEGLPAARLTASGTLKLIVQGAGGWRFEAPLDNRTASGQALALGGVVDLPAIQRDVEAAGHDASNASWAVVARVAYAAPGVQSSTFTLPIQYDPPLYVLPSAEALATTTAHGQPETRVTQTRAGLPGLLGAPAAPALALAGVGALVALVRLDAWRDDE